MCADVLTLGGPPIFYFAHFAWKWRARQRHCVIGARARALAHTHTYTCIQTCENFPRGKGLWVIGIMLSWRSLISAPHVLWFVLPSSREAIKGSWIAETGKRRSVGNTMKKYCKFTYWLTVPWHTRAESRKLLVWQKNAGGHHWVKPVSQDATKSVHPRMRVTSGEELNETF